MDWWAHRVLIGERSSPNPSLLGNVVPRTFPPETLRVPRHRNQNSHEGGLRGAFIAPLQFDAGFRVSVGLQGALDAPVKFGKHDVHFLGLPVYNVVLDLHHKRLYGGEFRRMQLQFRQFFQYGLDLCFSFCLRSVWWWRWCWCRFNCIHFIGLCNSSCAIFKLTYLNKI